MLYFCVQILQQDFMEVPSDDFKEREGIWRLEICKVKHILFVRKQIYKLQMGAWTIVHFFKRILPLWWPASKLNQVSQISFYIIKNTKLFLGLYKHTNIHIQYTIHAGRFLKTKWQNIEQSLGTKQQKQKIFPTFIFH